MSESGATGDRSARSSAPPLPSHIVTINLPGGFGVGEFPHLPPSMSWAGYVAVRGCATHGEGRPAGSWSVRGDTDHDRQPRETAIRPRPPVRAEAASEGQDATTSRDLFLVFAGPAWPSDQDCPPARLVGHFASLEDARQAFSRVTFRRLPTLHGRERWRGSAPFGGDIVQIDHRTSLRADRSLRH